MYRCLHWAHMADSTNPGLHIGLTWLGCTYPWPHIAFPWLRCASPGLSTSHILPELYIYKTKHWPNMTEIYLSSHPLASHGWDVAQQNFTLAWHVRDVPRQVFTMTWVLAWHDWMYIFWHLGFCTLAWLICVFPGTHISFTWLTVLLQALYWPNMVEIEIYLFRDKYWLTCQSFTFLGLYIHLKLLTCCYSQINIDLTLLRCTSTGFQFGLNMTNGYLSRGSHNLAWLHVPPFGFTLDFTYC